MKHKNFPNQIFFILVLIFSAINSIGGGYRYISTKDGLKNNAVYAITQDSKGRMWFGTIIGLYKYDGSTVRFIQPDSELDVGSLIYSITEDDDNKLWIGTNKGVSILDLKTEKFIPFNYRTDDGKQITSTVRNVFIDSNGMIWISTMGQGLFILDKKTGELENFSFKQIPDHMIKHVMEDDEGNLWITTINGYFVEYDMHMGKFLTYKDNRICKGWIGYQDELSNIWMGTAKGLFLFDRKTHKFIWKIKPLKDNGILEIKSIVEPTPGNLLLATDEGLIQYNTASGKTIIEKGESVNKPGLNDNYLHALYIDSEKGLWVGTYFGGVNYLSPTSSNFDLLSDVEKQIGAKVISVFAKDSLDNIWIGTDDAGLIYIDRKHNTIKSFNPEKENIKFPTYQNIHALLTDGSKLYVGMYMGGLDIYDTKTGKVRNLKESNSVNSFSSNIYALYKDIHGIIWIGSQGGLNTYDPLRKRFQYHSELGNISVSDIKEDHRGNLWVTTLGDGIFKYKERDRKWKRYLPTASSKPGIIITRTTYITVDDNDDLWIGTEQNGLCKYDYAKDNFTDYSLENAQSQVVYCIIPDKDYLWISTTNGIIRFNPISGKIENFNEGDGLRSNQFSPAAGIKLNDGIIIFGNINGFNAFDPSEMKINTSEPEVIFTDLWIKNKIMEIGTKESPLKDILCYTQNLKLKYKQSAFSIGFTALNYTNSVKDKYYYKLEGFDKKWIKTDYPVATYTNLPAGKYRLIVKTGYNETNLSEKEATMDIRILRPFLLSIPFLIIYILLFTYICFYTCKKIQKRHLNKIRELNVHNEKELYNSKMEFYTNIIHELRTPLTLITGPLDIIMKGEGPVENFKSELKMIQDNSQRLLNLVNSFMDFRKIEAGGDNICLKRTNICVTIFQIFNRFKVSAKIKNIKVSISLPETDCYAMIDNEALTKIICNLMSNALKFTSSSIKLGLNDTGEYLEITVQDDGIGISKENQSRIFDTFYQIKGSVPSDNIGSGIGLSIVKKLVSRMNGHIRVESSIGKGSKFVVIFPKLDSAKEEKEPEEKNISEHTIMIVEDNPSLLDFLTILFEKRYRILTAIDGEKAFELIQRQRTDLVISDIMMPNMNGLELCKKIKTTAELSHIPVILLTAKADSGDKMEGYRNYADAYIEKPFDEEVLKAEVASIIFNREKLKEDFIKQPVNLISSVSSSDVNKDFLKRISEIIGKNMDNSSFTIDNIASELCMGRSKFYDKVKTLTGTTPNDFLKIERLKNAAFLFAKEKGTVNVNEVSYKVGFSSPSYFTKCFRKQFGISPSEYIKNIKDDQPFKPMK